MEPFFEYLASLLKEKLERRRVVVFYDPRREFGGFMDDLLENVSSSDTSPEVAARVLDLPVRFLLHEGSLIALKFAAESLTAAEWPDPLVLYLPGVERDRRASVLRELERAGDVIDNWSLKQLARNCLLKHSTEGVIDELLRPANVSYDDVIRFLQDAKGGSASQLKLVFGGADWRVLLARWLADGGRDAEIEQRGAQPELLTLIQTRLGLELSTSTPLPHARTRAFRHVLIGEFRSDLRGEEPPSLRSVPAPSGREQIDRVRLVAQTLRDTHSDAYVVQADLIEAELKLAEAGLSPEALGSIDTFRFEEELLFRRTAELLARERWSDAAGIVDGRSRSFWVDRSIERQAQWEACRRAAELGGAVAAVRKALLGAGVGPEAWVESYVAEGGWHRADSAHRALEEWVSRMDDAPECEQGAQMARRAYDDLLQAMTGGFVAALSAAEWTVPGVLHQTRIHADIVEPIPEPVAYFFVDAMRYEMGAELVSRLRGAEDLRLVPAIGVLPSITPLGMAALLPGASASYSVVERGGKLAARIGCSSRLAADS